MIPSMSILRTSMLHTIRSMNTCNQVNSDPQITGLAYHHGSISSGHLKSNVNLFFPELNLGLSPTGVFPLKRAHNFVTYFVNESDILELGTKIKEVHLSAVRVNQLIDRWNKFNNLPRVIHFQIPPNTSTHVLTVESLKKLLSKENRQFVHERNSLFDDSMRFIDSIGDVPTGLVSHRGFFC